MDLIKVKLCPYWEYRFQRNKMQFFQCLLETFYFEIIAFPDGTLYSAVFRVIAAATTALKGFQGRVNGGMRESEDSSFPGPGTDYRVCL